MNNISKNAHFFFRQRQRQLFVTTKDQHSSMKQANKVNWFLFEFVFGKPFISILFNNTFVNSIF